MLYFFLASSPSLTPILANASLSIKDWANSSLSIPAAFANASCWITFILVKSLDDPTCLATSAAASAVFPSKANCRAFSKFNSFPVNNSALNSLSIEDSNWSKLEDIFSACSRVKPNIFACTTASAILDALPPNDNFKEADILLTSFKTSFSLTTMPFLEAYALAPPKISLVLSSKLFPWDKDSFSISINSLCWNPAWVTNLVIVVKSFSFNIALVPKAAPTAIYDSWRFLVFKATSPDIAAMFPNSLRVFNASP